MFDRIFGQSSGRVVAIARLSLAALFLIATVSDPTVSPPVEIELVLASYPDVEEVAVVGVPDEEWGERVAAVVVPFPGAALSVERLSEHCHERLASFKKPEIIVFAEALPRNALGKVLRSQLRAELAEAGAVVGGARE